MREKKNAKNREKEERKNIECKKNFSRTFAFFFSRISRLKKINAVLLQKNFLNFPKRVLHFFASCFIILPCAGRRGIEI
jgi:hypothetical protein